jgi:hypothetical protein
LELVRPYYTLRHLLPDLADQLRTESSEFYQQVLKECRIPETGDVSSDLSRRTVPCIDAAFRRQKNVWSARVAERGVSSARQEIERPLTQHIQLQENLKRVGSLPSDASVDGVYGNITRTAIAQFQLAERLTSDGLMSSAVAERLTQRVRAVNVTPESAATPELLSRINALREKYAAYLSEVNRVDQDRRAKAESPSGKKLSLWSRL